MGRHLVDCSAECTYKQLRGGHISQSLHGIIYIANIITWHLLNQKKLAECWAAMAFWRTTTTACGNILVLYIRYTIGNWQVVADSCKQQRKNDFN